LKDGCESGPLELDAIYWMGSCTKLMTAISALQCVERGQFTIDEDVTRLLPELKNIQIQTGLDIVTGLPVLVTAKNKITLRYYLMLKVARTAYLPTSQTSSYPDFWA
jgi:CubicO group peptidase (beta-lactamase class C family)